MMDLSESKSWPVWPPFVYNTPCVPPIQSVIYTPFSYFFFFFLPLLK
jgi:hypothetical protein